jgi:hypothetical protein
MRYEKRYFKKGGSCEFASCSKSRGQEERTVAHNTVYGFSFWFGHAVRWTAGRVRGTGRAPGFVCRSPALGQVLDWKRGEKDTC